MKSTKAQQVNLSRSTSGFTLVEIMVAIVIMAIIMVMIIYPFISSTGYLAKARARAETQQVAREVLDTMTRELSDAMDIVLSPDDPSMCAFVPAQANTFPLQPADKVIRYWLVWRSNPNAAEVSNGALPANSPIGKSWYDKFSPIPRENRATPEDTDSRFIARTEFNFSDGLNDTNVLKRTVPDRQYDPSDPNPEDLIADRQYFVAISPDEPNFDVPVLRFTATPQVNETLQKDSSGAYVFKAKYPLWESNWSVTVYDDEGNPVTAFTSGTASPLGIVDPYNGKVSFVGENYASENINGTSTISLSATPILNSETVVVDDQIYTKIDSSHTPLNNEYTLSYDSTNKVWNLTVAPAGTIGTITYKYASIASTDVVTASYSTRALLNIDIIASKRDTQAGLPQTIHLQQKVKLKNVVR